MVTRRRWVLGGVVFAGLLAVVAVGLAAFQPWKLFTDTRVDEALPSASAVATTAPEASVAASSRSSSPSSSPSSAQAPSAPAVLGRGSFRSFEHRTTGTALVLRLADGSQVVRLQDLATSDGPDVHVWLARAPATATEDAFPPGHVELGRLKGNLGNQNYAVPRGVDPLAFTSVVIWCERFSVAFAAATVSR
jgi:hypothetical protein